MAQELIRVAQPIGKRSKHLQRDIWIAATKERKCSRESTASRASSTTRASAERGFRREGHLPKKIATPQFSKRDLTSVLRSHADTEPSLLDHIHRVALVARPGTKPRQFCNPSSRATRGTARAPSRCRATRTMAHGAEFLRSFGADRSNGGHNNCSARAREAPIMRAADVVSAVSTRTWVGRYRRLKSKAQNALDHSKLTCQGSLLGWETRSLRGRNREKRPLRLHRKYLSQPNCGRIISPTDRKPKRHRSRFRRCACGSWTASKPLCR